MKEDIGRLGGRDKRKAGMSIKSGQRPAGKPKIPGDERSIYTHREGL